MLFVNVIFSNFFCFWFFCFDSVINSVTQYQLSNYKKQTEKISLTSVQSSHCSQLLKFVLISHLRLEKNQSSKNLEISTIFFWIPLSEGSIKSQRYKSLRIEEKIWRYAEKMRTNSKEYSELKYFQNVKSSVSLSIDYFIQHIRFLKWLFTVQWWF